MYRSLCAPEISASGPSFTPTLDGDPMKAPPACYFNVYREGAYLCLCLKGGTVFL